MTTTINDMAQPSNEHSELEALREMNAMLTDQVVKLKQQLDWFKRQLFGKKSEKRLITDNPNQCSLFDGVALPESTQNKPATRQVAAHKRRIKERDGCATDAGLRFDENVPVKVVEILPDELQGANADDYEIVSYKVTYQLAQQQASYLVIKEQRPVIRKKSTQQLITTPAPVRVLEKSIADVSFLAGMLVDKFQFHLPFYRQHQRLTEAGITLSRGLLTQLSAKAIALLKPIADAQFRNVLLSKVLAIDETPIRAGRAKPGVMKQGYFWPMHGDQGEIAFHYCASRSGKELVPLLQDYQGILLTDGYAPYERFAAARASIQHAQCWAHTRRCFDKALKIEPDAAREALDIIGAMYKQEEDIRKHLMDDDKKLAHRQAYTAPIVQHFWKWCYEQTQRLDLTPTNPLSAALQYALKRKAALEMFLNNAGIPIDTNHLERGLRCIPMGKENWLFCWTESGAEDVAVIQSLIATCRLQGINAYDYFVDVLQRVGKHRASEIDTLTPRLWKEHFAKSPMRSVIDQAGTV